MPNDKANTTGTGAENVVTTTGIPSQADAGHVNVSAPVPDLLRVQLEAEQKISGNVMSICLTSDGIIIKDEDKEDNEDSKKLAGVYCEGVQYYDLNGIQYINNTGMAILIDLLKNLLEMGVEVQFVNVHESIKKKIRDLGLEKIINYGEKSAT